MGLPVSCQRTVVDPQHAMHLVRANSPPAIGLTILLNGTAINPPFIKQLAEAV